MGEEEFLRKLIPTFREEAREQIKKISLGLIELEKAKSPADSKAVAESAYRETHNLKSAAGTIDLPEMIRLCQAVEDIFSRVKLGNTTLSPEAFDLLHETTDFLAELLEYLEAGISTDMQREVEELALKLEQAAESGAKDVGRRLARGGEGKGKKSTRPTVKRGAALEGTDTIRMPTDRLDSLLFQAEELVVAKLAVNRRVVQTREAGTDFARRRKEWMKIYPNIRTAEEEAKKSSGPMRRQITRILEFLKWDNEFAQSVEERIGSLIKDSESDQRTVSQMVDSLLHNMKQSVMLSFSSLLQIYPRLVRDLARTQDKQISLEITGGDIEVDKRILEEIKDPLTHLVRNSVDHGIEAPPEREEKGKSREGHLKIVVTQKEGSKIELMISDDGAGIDAAKVRSSALAGGEISQPESEKLTDKDIVQRLIFESGISTISAVSEVSGRGLGLAIVREKIERLNGTVAVDSQPGAGTTFLITLPLTLATFRGILVSAEDRQFVFPTRSVSRVITVRRREIKTVENRETIQLNGQAVSLLRLRDVLGLTEVPEHPIAVDRERSEIAHAVVLGPDDQRLVLLVDQVIDEEEVLVKGLGEQLARVRNISGATVLSSGQVVPVINVADLLRSCTAAEPIPAVEGGVLRGEEEAERHRSILLVEDSITTRALLKNILEAANYEVITAVDGADAWSALQARDFDVVVSDVVMPQMNGFELTEKVRADERLAKLPVILVTRLESSTDRERGLDAGANAYVIKSGFDQTLLLETIRKLV